MRLGHHVPLAHRHTGQTRYALCLSQGVYKVPYPPFGEGAFNIFWGEEYQVVKRVREYHGCGKENYADMRERRSNIIFSKITRLLGRKSSGERGSGDGNFGEEIQDFKKWGWGRI